MKGFNVDAKVGRGSDVILVRRRPLIVKRKAANVSHFGGEVLTADCQALPCLPLAFLLPSLPTYILDPRPFTIPIADTQHPLLVAYTLITYESTSHRVLQC